MSLFRIIRTHSFDSWFHRPFWVENLLVQGRLSFVDALLDLPEARQRLKRCTVAEYEQLAERGAVRKNVELIRGLIVEKMSKSPLHRYTSLALYLEFHAYY